MTKTISINREDYIDLMAAYEQAVNLKLNSFTWKEHELLTSYARYLLEYLASKIEKQP